MKLQLASCCSRQPRHDQGQNTLQAAGTKVRAGEGGRETSAITQQPQRSHESGAAQRPALRWIGSNAGYMQPLSPLLGQLPNAICDRSEEMRPLRGAEKEKAVPFLRILDSDRQPAQAFDEELLPLSDVEVFHHFYAL